MQGNVEQKSFNKDNLDSFKKESGLSDREIRKQLFGGGKKAMEAFFGGDKSSINVSELSGKLGTMLQGMETALNEGNAELAKNPSLMSVFQFAIGICCTINSLTFAIQFVNPRKSAAFNTP